MTFTVESLRAGSAIFKAVAATTAMTWDDEVAHLLAVIAKDDRAAAYVVFVFNRGKVASAESVHDEECPCPESITPKMKAKVEEIAAALPE